MMWSKQNSFIGHLISFPHNLRIQHKADLNPFNHPGNHNTPWQLPEPPISDHSNGPTFHRIRCFFNRKVVDTFLENNRIHVKGEVGTLRVNVPQTDTFQPVIFRS